MKKPSKTQQQKKQEPRSNISPEVHREASRIAKNLMKLPPNPLKRK